VDLEIWLQPLQKIFACNMDDERFLLPENLPDATTPFVEFKDSTFFRRHGPRTTLPTVEACHIATNDKSFEFIGTHYVVFEHLGLFVKFGPSFQVTTNEGLTLWALQLKFGSSITCPEINGWRIVAGFTYLVMEHIPGVTLDIQWNQCREAKRIKSVAD
jgi:hypothetical protein